MWDTGGERSGVGRSSGLGKAVEGVEVGHGTSWGFSRCQCFSQFLVPAHLLCMLLLEKT